MLAQNIDSNVFLTVLTKAPEFSLSGECQLKFTRKILGKLGYKEPSQQDRSPQRAIGTIGTLRIMVFFDSAQKRIQAPTLLSDMPKILDEN